MLTRLSRNRLIHPVLAGSLFYWFYWSFVGSYDPFLNVYYANLGLSGVEIGILATIMPPLLLFFVPFVTALADKKGWRLHILLISSVGWMAMLLLFPIPRSFWGLFPLVVLLSIFRSPTSSIADSLIATSAERRHLSYGSFRMWGSLGFATFSILGGIVWERIGYDNMFLIAVLVGLPVLLMIANLEQIPQEVSAEDDPPGPVWDLLKDKGILVLSITSFLSGVALLTSYLFGGVYMQQLGGSETAVGLMFGLSALAEVPVMQRSGLLMARYGGPQTLALALILASLAVGFHAVAWSPTMLVLASVVKGFGVGIVLVALISIANERAPKAWASTAQSVVGGCFFGLAPFVSSIPSGLIFDRWGGPALFTIASLSALVGVGVLWLGIRKDWFQPRRRPLV